jgi:hypothetical protein
MNSFAETLDAIDETGWLIIGIVVVVVAYEFLKPSGDGSQPSALAKGLGIPDPTDTTGDPNSIGDTSSAVYAGNGLLGWAGNVMNQAFGGIPQSLGTALGGAAADVTGN